MTYTDTVNYKLGVVEICKMCSVNSDVVFEALQNAKVSCSEFVASWAHHRIAKKEDLFGLKVMDLLFCDKWEGDEV